MIALPPLTSALTLALAAVLATANAGFETVRASQLSDVERLWDSLNGSDNHWVRPDLEATTVDVTLGVKSVVVFEMQSTVAVSAWLKLEWNDSSKAWKDSADPAFKSIKVLHLSKMQLWHPDICLMNSWAGKGAGALEGPSAALYPDGRIVWTPSSVFEAYCELDLRRWPFERHECSLHFGSFTLDSKELKFGKVGHVIEFPAQVGEFIVESVKASNAFLVEDGAESFEGVKYTIVLRREPGTYNAVIFAPAAVVVILCLASFLLPPRAGEKVILGGVNAILICLFLIYFAHSLPVLTNQTPLIVMFYSASLYLVCLSLSGAVVTLNISRQPHSAGLPWTAKRILSGSFGRVLLLSSYIEQIMGVDLGPCARQSPARQSSTGPQEEVPVVMHDEMDPQSEGLASSSTEIGSKSVNPNHEWLLLAAAIDRVLFVVYSLLFLVLAIAFHV
ncbi:Neuronal acetylcholine receptor subunit beta-3 [Frankliniella fusca]|uniref:Neuronal acetylcholine receptor subunit beta-3 n=1 Tax=Frankliniella fusca TaxID=407009 RepID=A0AAE1HA60_9NEOP|nr:Neuronal acetylcholine receptor subunit beta-3 [Frankliniella fusca]